MRSTRRPRSISTAAGDSELNEGTFSVSWEVGKLYYGRPLTTSSKEDDVQGLLVSEAGYREALAGAGGDRVELPYPIHAANLRAPTRGSLFLR